MAADRRLVKECLGNPMMWPAASLYAIKKWLGQKQIKIRRQGLTMFVGPRSGEGAWQGISGLDYEPELRQILARIKTGDVILDIGANRLSNVTVIPCAIGAANSRVALYSTGHNGPAGKETMALLLEAGYVIGRFDAEERFVESADSGNLFAIPREKLAEFSSGGA